MKNYIVQATREFDDYEGLECKAPNVSIKRKKNDLFNCTKERYEYLKSNRAVLLRGIEKVEEIQEVIIDKSRTVTADIEKEEVPENVDIAKVVKKRTTKKK